MGPHRRIVKPLLQGDDLLLLLTQQQGAEFFHRLVAVGGRRRSWGVHGGLDRGLGHGWLCSILTGFHQTFHSPPPVAAEAGSRPADGPPRGVASAGAAARRRSPAQPLPPASAQSRGRGRK